MTRFGCQGNSPRISDDNILMSDHRLHLSAPQALSAEERAMLKKSTGRDYTAVLPGDPGDGHIGLLQDNAVDVLELEPGHSIEIEPFREVLELTGLLEPEPHYPIALLSHTTMAGRHPEKRLWVTPAIAKLFADHDVQQDHTVDIIARDEPTADQHKRIEAFNRLAESLTPELRSHILTVDFRHVSPMVFGYAQEDIQYLRLGRMDLCEETGYHEAAHLLTAHLEATDPTFRRGWDTITAGTYIDTCFEESPYEDEGARLAVGLISGYGANDYHEDISELTSAIYTEPFRVKLAMPFAPLFRLKIDFLFERHYIREDQYLYLTANGPYPHVLNPDCA